MQVMQPTDQLFNDVDSYCANDGRTFYDAIDALEEDKRWLGTKFEGWQQIPQEKVRLMQMLQQTINDGLAEKIIIISGDMHWGEMMAKRMPAFPNEPSQVIFEVTASGIDKNWPTADPNANRIRIRTADTQGDGMYQRECRFPFRYKGSEYNDCIELDQADLWCALKVDADDANEYVSGQWGNCMPKELELVPRGNITVSGEHSCDDSLHVCSARANYGGIEIDWDNNFMKLSIFTPHATEPVAAEVRIGL
jgi:alkaline phosphatase D